MQVQDIIIGGKAAAVVGGIIQGERQPLIIIDEIHNRCAAAAADRLPDDLTALRHIAMHRIIDLLGAANPVCIVGITNLRFVAGGGSVVHIGQLPAVAPRHIIRCVILPARIAGWISASIVRNAVGLTAMPEARQKVIPAGIPIGVGLDRSAVLLLGQQIPCCVVGICRASNAAFTRPTTVRRYRMKTFALINR